MSFVIIGDDGQPEPAEVQHPLVQLRDIFGSLASRAYTAAFCTHAEHDGIPADDEPEERTSYCVRCSRDFAEQYLDSDNVCEDCIANEVRYLHRMPVGDMVHADYVRLAKLGYPDPNYSLDSSEFDSDVAA